MTEILQDKKERRKKNGINVVEKVSRKRNIFSLNDDILLPSREDDNETLTNLLESKRLNNLMLPPKIPSKKMKGAAKTDTSQFDQIVPSEDILQVPRGLERNLTKGGDKLRFGTKPGGDPFGFGSSSSSSVLNMSTSVRAFL